MTRGDRSSQLRQNEESMSRFSGPMVKHKLAKHRYYYVHRNGDNFTVKSGTNQFHAHPTDSGVSTFSDTAAQSQTGWRNWHVIRWLRSPRLMGFGVAIVGGLMAFVGGVTPR
jgi:hypothetical protein